MKKILNAKKLRKENSRTTNTIFNFTSSIGGQLITIIMQFVVRTVFIHTLGKSYLGINGLFSNVLTMLSLAEMGVGSAILYKLYKPIADGDYHRITILMKFYRTVYRCIGAAVAVIGLCLIPFLPYIIKDNGKLESLNINVVLIFCLYLLKTVSSYLFFAYRSAIVKAHQKEYLLNIISYFFTFGLALAHIVFLLIFPNFYVYVILTIAEVILKNVVCAVLSDKMYPYIKDTTEDKLDIAEIKGIFKDCGALFLYKLNNVVVKATDNIVISMFLGIDMVGLYSNYYIFYTTIRTLFNKIFNSVSHSLGNLHATETGSHEYKIFKSVNFVTAILGATAGVGIAVCGDELIRVWIGSEWIIPMPFSILLGIEVFDYSYKVVSSKYRTTMGLFQQAKFRPVFGMIINLVVSVALVNMWGVSGVLVGTVVSDWATMMWYDPLIIHKVGFKNKYPASGYFKKLFSRTAITALIGLADYFICSNLFTGWGWFSVIIHACICAVTVPGILILVSIRTEEGQYLLKVMGRYTKKMKKKLKKA